jgi:hypothetical protein
MLPGAACGAVTPGAGVRFAWWLRWPLRGDDRVEFCADQVLVGAQQVEELLVHGRRAVSGVAVWDVEHDRHLELRR